MLRSGASALKAENAVLCAAAARASRVAPAAATAGEGETPLVEACLAMDVHAPAAARQLVADRLCGELGPRRLEMAQLLISELVTERLGEAASPEQTLVVRVRPDSGRCRLEVEAPGRAGAPPRARCARRAAARAAA